MNGREHAAGGLNGAASQIVEEDAETKLVRDGNGALLRFWKHKSGNSEHVDFLVKDRAGWEEAPVRIGSLISSQSEEINRGKRKTYREKALRIVDSIQN